jgi:hypothetical protein
MQLTYNILFGMPEGRRLVGRARHRWENNIKVGRRETVMKSVDWIHLARSTLRWLAHMNMVITIIVL